MARLSFQRTWRSPDEILLSDTAVFTVSANLSDQHFVRASGLLAGEVYLHGNGTRYPDATFKLTADDLAAAKFNSKRVEAEGSFSWPEVNLSHVFIRVAEGAELRGHGLVDLQEQYIRTADVEVKGTLPKNFVPTNMVMGDLFLTAKLSGPLGHRSSRPNQHFETGLFEAETAASFSRVERARTKL